MSTFKVWLIGVGPYHVDAEVFHNKRRYAIVRFASGATPVKALHRACERISDLEDKIGEMYEDALAEERRKDDA